MLLISFTLFCLQEIAKLIVLTYLQDFLYNYSNWKKEVDTFLFQYYTSFTSLLWWLGPVFQRWRQERIGSIVSCSLLRTFVQFHHRYAWYQKFLDILFQFNKFFSTLNLLMVFLLMTANPSVHFSASTAVRPHPLQSINAENFLHFWCVSWGEDILLIFTWCSIWFVSI